jgi:hypothetical protein
MKIGDIVLVEDDDFNPSFKFIREIDIIDYYETEFGKYSHYNPIASRFSKPGCTILLIITRIIFFKSRDTQDFLKVLCTGPGPGLVL